MLELQSNLCVLLANLRERLYDRHIGSHSERYQLGRKISQLNNSETQILAKLYINQSYLLKSHDFFYS